MTYTISGRQIKDEDRFFFDRCLVPQNEGYKTLRDMGFFCFPDGEIEEFDFDGLYSGRPHERHALMFVYHHLGPLMSVAKLVNQTPEEVINQIELQGRENYLDGLMEKFGVKSVPELERLAGLSGHIQKRFYSHHAYVNYEAAAQLLQRSLSDIFQYASHHASKRGMIAYV